MIFTLILTLMACAFGVAVRIHKKRAVRPKIRPPLRGVTELIKVSEVKRR